MILTLVVYKQVFWYLNFANHGRKESFVSTANEPLVGTLMTIGNLTISITIKVKQKHVAATVFPLWHVPFGEKVLFQGWNFALLTVAWNLTGFYPCVLERKCFIYFPFNSLLLAPCSRSLSSLSNYCQESFFSHSPGEAQVTHFDRSLPNENILSGRLLPNFSSFWMIVALLASLLKTKLSFLHYCNPFFFSSKHT